METYRVEIKQTFEIIANSEMEAVSISDDYIKNSFIRGKGELLNAEIYLRSTQKKAASNVSWLADYR